MVSVRRFVEQVQGIAKEAAFAVNIDQGVG